MPGFVELLVGVTVELTCRVVNAADKAERGSIAGGDSGISFTIRPRGDVDLSRSAWHGRSDSDSDSDSRRRMSRGKRGGCMVNRNGMAGPVETP